MDNRRAPGRPHLFRQPGATEANDFLTKALHLSPNEANLDAFIEEASR